MKYVSYRLREINDFDLIFLKIDSNMLNGKWLVLDFVLLVILEHVISRIKN